MTHIVWVMWCASMKSVLLLVRIVIFRDVFHPIALNYTLNVRCYNFKSRNVFHWRTIRVQHIKWICRLLAYCCRLLQTAWRLLQTVSDCCKLLQTVANYCRLLQTVADCCKLLQTVADCCSHISFLMKNFHFMLCWTSNQCLLYQTHR